MTERVEEKSVRWDRQLPDDLPTSLDDRKPQTFFGQEMEVYDAWQGNYHKRCVVQNISHR